VGRCGSGSSEDGDSDGSSDSGGAAGTAEDLLAMLCDHKPALAQALPAPEFQDLLDGMQRLGISGASATGAPRRDALSPRHARATIATLARRRL